MLPEIRNYLDEVRSYLHLDQATQMWVISDLCSYFEEKTEELQGAGLSEKEAARVAIECCGRPRVIARRMYEAHSKGSWNEAAWAFLPHLVIAFLFLSHLWHHPVVAPIGFGSVVMVALYGWWHSKPSWMYPWVGYSLLPLLIAGWVFRPAILQTASFLLWGQGSLPSIWALLLICALIAFSGWIIVQTTIKVARRDWILASLMLVPLPVVGGWLLNLERAGGLLVGSAEALHLWDMPMALALLTLGLTSAIFIRVRQRVLKVGALVSIGTIALAMVAHNLWGDQVLLGMLTTSLVLLLFLLSPALLEATMGHGEPEGEAWWEHSWAKHSSTTR